MKNAVVILFLNFLTLTSWGQANPFARLTESTKKRIDQLFSESDNLESPGYAVGISKNGETLYRSGYGVANLDYNIPITPKSAFSIASVSKQFTAACVALLILENKVSLETPVFF